MSLFRWLAFCLFLIYTTAYPTEQQPLIVEGGEEGQLVSKKGLHGKFLHITGTRAL